MIEFPLPLLGFAAWSGTGKTALLSRLVPLLKIKGIRTGLIKHTHHTFEIDHPGKDSFVLREAGARELVIAGPKRMVSITETPERDSEPTLQEALECIHPQRLDLVLVEGFKSADIPKIELHRVAMDKCYLYEQDPNIIAIADDDASFKPIGNIVHLDLNQPQSIAEFIEDWMRFIQGQQRQ